jgi:hypothetical protein
MGAVHSLRTEQEIHEGQIEEGTDFVAGPVVAKSSVLESGVHGVS